MINRLINQYHLRSRIQLVVYHSLYHLGKELATTRRFSLFIHPSSALSLTLQVALRFLVGLFESAYYPGMLFLIGNWYTKDELGKRSNIFQAATAFGTLVSGLLQAGVHTGLNGKQGMPGWRWIFIIDACIGIPIAICAFFFIPDLPWNIKPYWLLKQRHLDTARARLAELGREGPKKGGLRPKAWLKYLSTWHIWVFVAFYSCYIFAQSELHPHIAIEGIQRLIDTADPQQSMAFWLRFSESPKYSVEQIN